MLNATAPARPYVASASRYLARLFTRHIVWYSLIAWLILILSIRRIAESDIWYHLRNAQLMAMHRSVIHADMYTFTASGAPIVDYEWLSELFYFGAYQSWGQRGLLAVYALLLMLTYGGVYYLACRRGANHVEAAIVTLLGVALGSYSFGPRMMHFGWLCLVGLLIILQRSDRNPRLIWLLPPLFCIWVNLHASWVFGLVVMGAWILGGMVQGEWGRVTATRWTRTHLRSLIAATGASVAALFVNPYGLKLVQYPFEFLFRQTSAVSVVVEWESVNFHSPYGKLALAMILGTLVLVWRTHERWKLTDVLLILFALWTSLTHVRFLGFAAIILVPIIARRLRLMPWNETRGERPLFNAILLAVMLAAMVRTIPAEDVLESAVNREFPQSALGFMREKQIGGRLFHAYDFGGYIEWNAPSQKTFADGRTDIFVYNGVLDDYLRIVSLDSTFQLLDSYRIDHVLYPTGAPLSYLLAHSSSWRLIHEDRIASLFERRPSEGDMNVRPTQ